MPELKYLSTVFTEMTGALCQLMTMIRYDDSSVSKSPNSFQAAGSVQREPVTA
ncbi:MULTISPECIES: hypothetical protein [Brenneria]|uniref:hypothetical protein n=1 Tax=Brenneria TaxID=71655 RepID=UPI00022F801C|nr:MULTISPECIES: hypothetical protein [Brenneria]EHD23561.1 hypothetical protein BrE312_4242 [Brenneria sp. EniD312]